MPAQLGGSGVLVQPMTYIFDEEPARWIRLLESLGLTDEQARGPAGSSRDGNANGNGNGLHA